MKVRAIGVDKEDCEKARDKYLKIMEETNRKVRTVTTAFETRDKMWEIVIYYD